MTIKILALCGFTQNATIYSKQVSVLSWLVTMVLRVGSAHAPEIPAPSVSAVWASASDSCVTEQSSTRAITAAVLPLYFLGN